MKIDTNTQEINKEESPNGSYWKVFSTQAGDVHTMRQDAATDHLDSPLAYTYGEMLSYEEANQIALKAKKAKEEQTLYEDILEEALRITGGDRNEDYGNPATEFEKVATMWSQIIGAPVEMRHVPLMMIALKICRECNRPKRDNMVDIAGYARVGQLANDNQEP